MEKSHIQQEKRNLRSDMRRTMSMGQKHNEETILCHQLLILPELQRAHSILIYSPLPHEPNLLALLKKASHRFFFPRMNGDELEIYEWFAEAPWIIGRYSVHEPDPQTWRLASISEIDLALIPGMAFDPQGHRLGRGAGYFDRLLGNPACRARKIGISWSWQMITSLPSEEHDVPMDLVVTPERIFQAD